MANGLSPVKDTLEEHFDGRAITEQNLSEWKQRGFKDWQRDQETRALAAVSSPKPKSWRRRSATSC